MTSARALKPAASRFSSGRPSPWRRSSTLLLRFSPGNGYAAGTTNRIAERAGRLDRNALPVLPQQGRESCSL